MWILDCNVFDEMWEDRLMVSLQMDLVAVKMMREIDGLLMVLQCPSKVV